MSYYSRVFLIVACVALAVTAATADLQQEPPGERSYGNPHAGLAPNGQLPPGAIPNITVVFRDDGTVSSISSEATPSVIPDGPGYRLMGVKWKNFPVPWSIDDASDGDPLTPDNQYRDMAKSLKAWDKATSRNLVSIIERFSNIGGIDLGWYTGSPDGWNTIEMDAVGYIRDNYGPGIIGLARAYVNPGTNRIVEADVLLNDVKYGWSSFFDPKTGTMIVRNIGTHEAGHAFGLLDVTNTSYAEATMFRLNSSIYGETAKCTLWTGDIAGIQKLYGI